MLTIKRDGITVVATGSIVPFTKTDSVVSEGYEASLDQVQSSLQLGITGKPGRFIFTGLGRLVWTKDGWRLPA